MATLKASQATVAETVPSEGATGWIDSWMISAGARHPGCAYRWLRYMSSAGSQARLSTSYGASPANPLACPLMDEIRKGSCAAFHGDAPESYLASISFWKTPQSACGDGGRKDCSTYVDWQRAWVQVETVRDEGAVGGHGDELQEPRRRQWVDAVDGETMEVLNPATARPDRAGDVRALGQDGESDTIFNAVFFVVCCRRSSRA